MKSDKYGLMAGACCFLCVATLKPQALYYSTLILFIMSFRKIITLFTPQLIGTTSLMNVL